MIPYKLALALGIPLAAACMMDRDRARGFAIALFGGMMLLPANSVISISGVPDLDKTAVVSIGILVGTLLFHMDALLQFRPRWYDLLLVAGFGCGVATGVTNHFGAYEGVSMDMFEFLRFVLPMLLARIHLNSVRALKTFLRVFVWAAVVYTPFAIWEWRMSPQIHRHLYGYFQHDFLQFRRFGFFRPVVCFRHALYLGRFFAVATFLAAFPLREELAARVPSFGRFLFLAPLVGLFTTMSMGPILLFPALTVMYFALRRWPWTGYVVPVIAIGWACLLFLGMNPLFGAVRVVQGISAERAQSLQYRLNALEIYRGNILRKPVFGNGRFGQGRIQNLATDSEMLIRSLEQGLVGAALYFGWWLCAIHTAIRAARMTRATAARNGIAGAVAPLPLCFAVSAIDVALDPQIVALGGGSVSTERSVRTASAALAAARRPRLLARRKRAATASAPTRLR